MITKFLVFNREAIESEPAHADPHIIVSIQSPKDPQLPKLNTSRHTLRVVRLVFHDMDDMHKRALPPEEWAKYEGDCFSQAQARQIVEAVRMHPEAEELLVHCDAGFSRSPAVAAALSKALTGDDKFFFKRYSPNMRVYRTILEAWHSSTGGP